MGVCPEINGTITLLYNPKFIDLMDDQFLKVVIEHEGIHLLNNQIETLNHYLMVSNLNLYNHNYSCFF